MKKEVQRLCKSLLRTSECTTGGSSSDCSTSTICHEFSRIKTNEHEINKREENFEFLILNEREKKEK